MKELIGRSALHADYSKYIYAVKKSKESMKNPPDGAIAGYKDRMLGRQWGLAFALETIHNTKK